MADLVASGRLEECETVIDCGLGTFVEVGLALMEIRDNKLYKQRGFSRFGDYVKSRFQLDRVRAYQLIDATRVADVLSTTGIQKTPANERVARPLTRLLAEPTLIPKAWQEVITRAEKDTNNQPIIYAKHVESVVKEYLGTNDTDARLISQECTEELKQYVDGGGKFGTIYADPPWAYGNQSTRAATDNHYETMTPSDIADLRLHDVNDIRISELAAEQCHLHLWTTNAFLFEAKDIMEAWGFEYKSCFVWVKPTMGIGNYWRVSHEFLLLGVKGGLTFLDRSQMSWAECKRGKHSAKPEAVRLKIETTSPAERLELFARKKVPGWFAWGNEIERDLLSDENL